MNCYSALRQTALVTLTLGFAACQYTPKYVINKPANATPIACTDSMNTSCNVAVDVQWVGVQVKPQPDMTLDGAALTITLTSSGKSAVGTFTTALGSHTFAVSGDLSGNNTIQTYSATSTFTVDPFVPPPAPTGGFTISAPSSDVLVERGKCATVTITISRMAPFTGAVTLTLSSPPTGVTAAAVTVATGATSGTLSICAGPSAAIGKVNVTVAGAPPAGTTGVVPAGTHVWLVVGREIGAFAEASPTPYTSSIPSSVTSTPAGFRADVAVGPPVVAQAYRATFFRGTTRIGSEIGFTKGPVSTLGGAGFCANGSAQALTRGVVLSGALPGTSSQNTFTMLDLTVNNPAQMTYTTDMTVTVNNQPYTFQPRIYFSRDCTLALVTGANKIGPSKNLLRVINLINGQPIGSEVPFETNIISALVRNSAGGAKQEVEVKVDTGAPTEQIVVIQIP